MKKIFVSLIIVLFSLCINIQICFAGAENPNPDIPDRPVGDGTLKSIISGAEDFAREGASQEGVEEKLDELQPFSLTVTSIFITIGTILAVIYISIMGIKFMMGSVEEKAEIKENLIPFIIGCAVVFGAYIIWSIMVNIGRSL